MVQHRVSNSNTSTQHLVEPYDPNINQNDYITILSMEVPTGKLYQVDAQGNIKKTPAANNASGYAYTRYCPDMETFVQINREVSNNRNMAIVLGYIKGTEDGTPYKLISTKKFEQLALDQGVKVDKYKPEMLEHDGMKVATRTKRMFHPSTLMLWDKDAVDGMPEELNPNGTVDEWMTQLCKCFPEIAGVDYVMIESASGRVLHNNVPISSGNIHVYMQANSAVDMARFGKSTLIQSFVRGYGFHRDIIEKISGKKIGERPWTIFDPTTFSHERLCFDGSPILDPKDINVMLNILKVAPSTPRLVKGSKRRVNTFALPTPTDAQMKALDLKFTEKNGRAITTNVLSLDPTIPIHVMDEYTGVKSIITMQQFIDGTADRYRCQTPFRPESDSYAAFLSKQDGCSPFMYDVGYQTKYMFNNVKEKFYENENKVRSDSVVVGSGICVDHNPVNSDGYVNDTGRSDLSNHDITDYNNPVGGANNDYLSMFDNVLGVDSAVLPPVATIESIIIPTPPIQSSVPTPPAAPTLPTAISAEYLQQLGSEDTNPRYGFLHQTAKEFSETELGNAQRFVGTFHHIVRYVPMMKSWFKWIGHRWEKCEGGVEQAMAHKMMETMVAEAANKDDADTFRKWAKTSCSNSGVKNTIAMASVMPEMVVRADDIDNHWYQFGVGNGFIDLRLVGDDVEGVRFDPCECGCGCNKLKGFQEADREVFITKSSHIDYVAGAVCPEWQKMIWDIFSGNGELVDFFQRMVGYSMMGIPKEEVTFVLVGDGSNGKSTVTGVMEELLGEYKATVDKSVLMSVGNTNGQSATPALARLKGIRMAVVTETKEGDVLDESMIKSLSGSDTVVARHLHSEIFEFKSMFTTWLATNHPPIIKSEDFGIWRRVLQIPFKRNFAKELGDKLDRGIGGRIRQNEMSGILNWALEGVLKYQIEGLNPPAEVLAATENYKSSMDVLHDWMEDCCEIGENLSVAQETLFKSYEQYTQRTGDQIIKTGRTLYKKLASRGYKRVAHVPNDNRRGFIGIRVKMADFGE